MPGGKHAWGSRDFIDRQAIVNVMPVVRCSLSRINPEGLDRLDQLEDAFDRPSRTTAAGSRRRIDVLRAARPGQRCSTGDRVVPKSLDVQRTNAKVLPGGKESTRRWPSMIFSATAWPNRIRSSIRFACHNSSTVVKSFAGCESVGLASNMAQRRSLPAYELAHGAWPPTRCQNQDRWSMFLCRGQPRP